MSHKKVDTSEGKEHVKLLVVVPIGPDGGKDTIESIFCYANDSVVILAIDDSRSASIKKYLQEIDPRVIRLTSLGYPGIYGALWLNLLKAYRYAYEHYTFDVLLKMDTDALLIDKGSELDAIAYFNKHKHAGMLGSYKIRSDGQKRSFNIVAAIILRESSLYGIRKNKRRVLIKKLVKNARKKGYRLGEHCQGGAVFLSYRAIKVMYENNYLDHKKFRPLYDSRIGEDHLFGLLTRLSGFTLEDFATKDFPMGIKWRGLPDSPENLVKQKKKVVHSVKFWQDLDQESINRYYADRRIQFKLKTKHD